MAQHEMTRHETRECAFYILFEMQFQNDTWVMRSEEHTSELQSR